MIQPQSQSRCLPLSDRVYSQERKKTSEHTIAKFFKLKSSVSMRRCCPFSDSHLRSFTCESPKVGTAATPNNRQHPNSSSALFISESSPSGSPCSPRAHSITPAESRSLAVIPAASVHRLRASCPTCGTSGHLPTKRWTSRSLSTRLGATYTTLTFPSYVFLHFPIRLKVTSGRPNMC